MNWMFRRRCSLMIILMICWMSTCKGSDTTTDIAKTCSEICNQCEKLPEHIKDNQKKACQKKCNDLLKNQKGSSDAVLLQSFIIQLSTGDISCQIEYDSCTVCRNMCRTCLKDAKNVSMDFCEDLCFGVCSPCVLNNDCEKILIIDGGFTGQIQRACSDKTSSCQNIFDGSPQFNRSNCLLSFETDPQIETNGTCRFSDSGVWLLKNNTHHINITRNASLRPTAPICFTTGRQTCNRTSELLTNCTQPSGNSSWLCENMICVDPETFCKEAQYKECSENDSNDDIIHLTGSSAECHKCGTAFKKTEGHITINFTFPVQQPNNNASYSEMMKDLTNIILQEMENKSSVSVSLEDISGIFVKPPNIKELKPAYFMYSSQFNIVEDETQMPKFERAFSVPKEAFEKASGVNISTLFASLLRFPKFPQDYKNSTLLNNEVYSIDMGGEISNLTNTFNLTFRNVDLNASDPLCYSWDGRGATPNWTTHGCNTSYGNGSVTCACQHLTFFAVLMTTKPQNISSSHLDNLTYITSIGCGLSLFFLSIALFMHFLLRRGRASVSVHILINLFLALFLLNLSFLINESVANTGNVIGCKLMAGVMHYSMLSTFTWFGLQALHLCLQLALNVTTIQNYITKLSIAGWVPPVLVVTAIFISQKYNKEDIVSNTGQTTSMCWITDPTVHYVVNIGYYSAIFLFTFLTFVVMLRWLWLLRNKRPTITMSGKRSRSSDALTIMGLCCILGLSWGFAFFAYGPMQIPAFYIFTILNSFQGFFMFVYYYKSSRLVGEAEASLEGSSTTTDATVVENPYGKHKTF
ncbi:hypothetical protein PHYPO_G00185030 [Pangasianodon hypophthalmus]|uniref:G-protein coupled receptors family 2 profile 2 domain-containing protein n=1 Tax=Pangasianodon hypophthalmus TaxID=310915 RepID=A0A5N5JHV4_PANHP|nr:hypothetical protein PHYPO_G00185030 [Pangasianodon hypophthalmus]